MSTNDLIESILLKLPELRPGTIISGSEHQPWGLNWTVVLASDDADGNPDTITDALGRDITADDVDLSDLDEDDLADGREVTGRIMFLQDQLLGLVARRLDARVRHDGANFVVVPQA
jgi:hypothetical protein